MRDLPWRSYCAGVLPFTVVDDKVYFLLGMDRVEVALSDFGGRAEAEDLGNHRVTAAREFFEETAGSVMDFNAACARLNDARRPQCVIHSTTYGGMVYFTHLMVVPWIPHAATMFQRFQSVLSKCTASERFREKSALQWISMDTLRAQVHAGGSRIQLRMVFKNTLLANWTRLQSYVQCVQKFSKQEHGVVPSTESSGWRDRATIA
jgi:hypothetical protein